jgi:hypothetical protein
MSEAAPLLVLFDHTPNGPLMINPWAIDAMTFVTGDRTLLWLRGGSQVTINHSAHDIAYLISEAWEEALQDDRDARARALSR